VCIFVSECGLVCTWVFVFGFEIPILYGFQCR
jgi:hypothetical protein